MVATGSHDRPIETYRVTDLDEGFFQEVNEGEGMNAQACFACGTCSGLCPTSFAMDHTPRQILRFVQWGMKEKAFGSNTIWLCAQCYMCQVQCPRGIKLTEIIAVLKRKAIKEYEEMVKGNVSNVFYKAFMENVRKNGRVHEVSFFMTFQRKTGGISGLIGYLPFGLNVFRKGKMSFTPHKIQQLKQIEDIFRKAQELEE